ncbi:hypothetical protein BH18GEM1_BH18GEM1_19340 [soil metagenome]
METNTEKLIEFDAAKLQTPAARRGFLAELAIAAGAVALAPMITQGRRLNGMLLANHSTLSITDILNYALTLEYLEATFYLRAEGRGRLPQGASVASIDPDGNGEPGRVPGLASVRPPLPATFNVMQFVRTVRDHEITHVLFLQNALGNVALDREDFAFDFGNAFDSAENFLAVSQVLEDTGVTAYTGQVRRLVELGNDPVLSAAGSIAGVEAEHAAAFRYINDVFITPNNASFDDPATVAEVLAAAGGFITEAPDLPFD